MPGRVSSHGLQSATLLKTEILPQGTNNQDTHTHTHTYIQHHGMQVRAVYICYQHPHSFESRCTLNRHFTRSQTDSFFHSLSTQAQRKKFSTRNKETIKVYRENHRCAREQRFSPRHMVGRVGWVVKLHRARCGRHGGLPPGLLPVFCDTLRTVLLSPLFCSSCPCLPACLPVNPSCHRPATATHE